MAVFAVLNGVVGEDLNEKLTAEKRLEGGNGVNHANMGGAGVENIPGGGTCTSKGSEASEELWLLHRVPWGSNKNRGGL